MYVVLEWKPWAWQQYDAVHIRSYKYTIYIYLSSCVIIYIINMLSCFVSIVNYRSCSCLGSISHICRKQLSQELKGTANPSLKAEELNNDWLLWLTIERWGVSIGQKPCWLVGGIQPASIRMYPENMKPSRLIAWKPPSTTQHRELAKWCSRILLAATTWLSECVMVKMFEHSISCTWPLLNH